ncbi:MAG TPA: hypothetical protein VGF84_00090 [Micromonosporaceae bacterium]
MPLDQAERSPQPFLLGRLAALPPTLTAPLDLVSHAAVDLFAQGKIADDIAPECSRSDSFWRRGHNRDIPCTPILSHTRMTVSHPHVSRDSHRVHASHDHNMYSRRESR